MKIAIFSGAIPSSTFIESLIKGVSEHHNILLFGGVASSYSKNSKTIKIFRTPYSHGLNLVYTIFRLVLLLLKSPKAVVQLFIEIKRYHRLYDKWIWFSKFLPIVLYKPDIFHIQWARDLEFYTFLKTRFNIPIVVSLRGAHINYTPIISPYIEDVYNKVFPTIEGFHAVSESMALAARQYGAKSNRIKVIHSQISNSVLDFYLPYRKKSRPFYVGCVGRFHWVKGMRYAFDACALLKAQNFDFTFTVVSSNAPTEEVLFQLDQLDLKDTVTILSELPQEQLFEVMKSFDVLLLPSLNEGIANVVLEAMALGIPVISTNCGGMPEVVIPDETGWLVPVRNAEAIANTIVEISQTSELDLQRITKNAHDFVKEHFNAEDSIRQFLELYDRVMIND